MFAIVDWDALLTVIWASLVAGIGVTAAFGFAILGGVRAVDLRRDGRVVEATLFGVVGVVGLVVVVGAIVFGIVVLSRQVASSAAREPARARARPRSSSAPTEART